MRKGYRAWLWLAVLLSLGLTLMPARGGADLELYRRMGRAVIEHRDPYLDPYADFPPLKMGLLFVLERLNAWAVFRILGFATLLGLSLKIVDRDSGDEVSRLAVLTLFFQPLVYSNWVNPFEDKWIYPLLFLAATWRRAPSRGASAGAPTVMSSLLFGLLAAFGTVHLVLAPLFAIDRSGPKQDWREIGRSLIVIALVFVASHALFYPGWIQGYSHRLVRQGFTSPIHESIFVLLGENGAYRPWMSSAATAFGLLCAYGVGWALRRWETGIVLGYFSLLAFGPEASYDRVLAAAFPMLLFSARRPIVFATISALMLIAAAKAFGPDRPPAVTVALLWLPVTLAAASQMTSSHSAAIRTRSE